MSDNPEVVVTINADTSQAQGQLGMMSTGFTSWETSVISTARRVTGGISGVMAATDRLYNAQQRVNVAQINYTLTVRQYGEGSIQAARALDQLRIAHNGVELATLRLYTRYAQFAISVGPQLYTMITRMIAASQGMTVQNYMEEASWKAKALAIGIAMGAMTGGLLLLTTLASGAAVNNNVNQTNQFYGTGTTNPQTMVDYANRSLVTSTSSKSRT